MLLASPEKRVLSICRPRRRAALPRAASNHPQAVKIRGPEFGCERRISAPWRLYNLSDSARCLLLLQAVSARAPQPRIAADCPWPVDPGQKSCPMLRSAQSSIDESKAILSAGGEGAADVH